MSEKVSVAEEPQLTEKNLVKQFSRYILTGVLSVGIEFSILLWLVEVHKMNYLIANLIAFTVTNLCNYFISRHWVFEKGKHASHIEFIIFFITAAVGLGINQLIMWGMVEHVHIDYRISKIAALVAVVIWNFWARKKLVFKG